MKRITLVFLAVVTACTATPQPSPAPLPSCAPSASAVPNVEHAVAISTSSNDVEIPRACCHLRALSCPLGAPTPGGATCEQWLAARACASGQAGCVDAQCVAQAASCADASACGR